MENNNFSYYRVKMRRYNSIKNKVGFIFILLNVGMLLLNAYMSIIHPEPILYFGQFIFIGISFFFAILGSSNNDTSKNIISIISYIILSFILGTFLHIISIIINIVFIVLNKQYHELEKIEGFPYFNERFEQEKANAQRDVYKEFADEVKSRNLGSKMDEI